MDILIKLAIGGLFAFVAFRIGFWMLRGLANPLPEPPPPGEMRRISLYYRCSICGMELKMTAAPNQEPEAPRHCQEDMEEMPPPLE